MASVKEKLKRLQDTAQKASNFVAAGGDSKSRAAAPVWMSLMGAFERVAEEFGYELSKPVRKTDAMKGSEGRKGPNQQE